MLGEGGGGVEMNGSGIIRGILNSSELPPLQELPIITTAAPPPISADLEFLESRPLLLESIEAISRQTAECRTSLFISP